MAAYGCKAVVIEESLEPPLIAEVVEKIGKGKIMKAEDHRKVAKWHLKQAELHESADGYKCGCPVNEQSGRIIEIVDSGVVEEGKECSL